MIIRRLFSTTFAFLIDLARFSSDMAAAMQRKVAILHQGFIPVYRAKFYSLLNQMNGTRYVVFHGPAPAGTAHKEFEGNLDFPNFRVRNIEFSLFGKKVIYQPVVLKILFGPFDAVVLGHEIHFLANLILFTICKIIRRPVVWWGQGFQKDQISNRAGPFSAGLVATVKNMLARLGDMYIVYTDGGAAKLNQAGVSSDKTRVVRNTIDMEEQRRLHAELQDLNPLELRKELNLRPDSKVLLFTGRIYREKRVGELISLVKELNSKNLCKSFVEAVIIGTGPELQNVTKIGNESDGIHFLGEVYDQRTVAQYMRIASALVIPGGVGLAVNHALAHGVPVITREHKYHGPELEYVIHEQNGLVIGGDFDRFVRVTADYLSSAERQRRMAECALSARDSLTLEFMVTAFDETVTAAIKNRRVGTAFRVDSRS